MKACASQSFCGYDRELADRPAGPSVSLDERCLPYPRICAHRGFHTTLPENTMPAFGAAVAMGADEIEFDLWESADGVPVSIHDCTLDRVSNGTGSVREKTLVELKQLNFGIGCDASMDGLKIATFEEILRAFARHTIMNIHIYSVWGEHFSRSFMKTIADLIHRYDCDNYVYLMGIPAVHEAALEVCPWLPRCMGADYDREKMQIVDRAKAYQCSKVQFFKPFFDQNLINYAHDNGIHCNCFSSDDGNEAQLLWHMGIDTILTNNFFQIFRAREEFLRWHKK